MRDTSNVTLSTMTAYRAEGTGKLTPPRPIRFLLFTDVLLLAEAKEGFDTGSDERGSHAVVERVDLNNVKVKKCVRTVCVTSPIVWWRCRGVDGDDVM